jgi:hypothetical protein
MAIRQVPSQSKIDLGTHGIIVIRPDRFLALEQEINALDQLIFLPDQGTSLKERE